MNPIREITKEASRKAVMGSKLRKKKGSYGPPAGAKIRPVSIKDFEEALMKVKKTGEAATSFKNSAENVRSTNGPGEAIDLSELAAGMKMMQMMMNGNGYSGNGEDNGDPTLPQDDPNAEIGQIPSL